MKKRTIIIAGISVLCCWWMFITTAGYGQLTKRREEVVLEQPTPETPDDVKDKITIATLRGIIQSMEAVQEQLAEKEEEYNTVDAEDKKLTIAKDIQALNQRMETLDNDFEEVSTGVDIEKFIAKPATSFDWQQELHIILGPIIEDLKDLTARPREIEELRSQIAYYEKRLTTVETALVNLQKRIEQAKARKLKNQLSELNETWEERKKDLTNQLSVARYQLEEILAAQQSLLTSAQSIFKDFFKGRGLNLVLAVFAFAAVLLGLRVLYRFVYKRTRLGDIRKRPFFIRLADVLYHLLTALIATVVFLSVLYISGDWVLLGIALLFLFGMAWSAKQTFPTFWEQTKLLLNLSTVREGERVIYNGLPWKVLSLNIYTKLHNPALKGGLIRLPLREMIGLQSRPFYKDEPWFPSEEEHLVKLADDTLGKVILQTPERVVLDTLGGCQKTYPTLSFLQQNPINYSINNFGVFVTFGLDYAHQALITREIPEKLQNVLAEELQKEEFGKDLIMLLVQFKEAAASSLDLLIVTTFPGHLAPNFFAIGRVLQRIAVDACNTYGWGIPFTQVTIHNAESIQEPLAPTENEPAEGEQETGSAGS